MVLDQKHKKAIYTCLDDLEHYYATCGSETDFFNLGVLKLLVSFYALDLASIVIVDHDVIKHKQQK